MAKRTERTQQLIPFPLYTFNREARKHFTFVISSGVGRYQCGMTDKELDELYPVPEELFYNPNSDRTREWMYDI